eukprot:7915884-Pyramimonas_sp.AAC.1
MLVHAPMQIRERLYGTLIHIRYGLHLLLYRPMTYCMGPRTNRPRTVKIPLHIRYSLHRSRHRSATD